MCIELTTKKFYFIQVWLYALHDSTLMRHYEMCCVPFFALIWFTLATTSPQHIYRTPQNVLYVIVTSIQSWWPPSHSTFVRHYEMCYVQSHFNKVQSGNHLLLAHLLDTMKCAVCIFPETWFTPAATSSPHICEILWSVLCAIFG